MIFDLLEYFKDDEDAKKKVIDNYKMKNGVYISFSKQGEINRVLKVDKDSISTEDNYEWFVLRDYLSGVSSTNKCFDVPKKTFHNSNYLTMFFKGASLFIDKSYQQKDDFEERFEFYFKKLNIVLNSEKIKDFYAYSKLSDVDENEISKAKEIFWENRDNVLKLLEQNNASDKEYVKLFIEEDIEIYYREFFRYAYPYIFNINEFNIEKDDTVYGLSANNMGLNTGKPYLVHKTTPFKVPFRISSDSAFKMKFLFDWLNTQRKGFLDINDLKQFSLNEKINSNMKNSHYLEISHEKEGAVINEYDYIPYLSNEIDEFQPRDYLNLTKQKISFEVHDTVLRDEMFQMVDQYLFRNRLKLLFSMDVEDIENISSKLKTIFVVYKNVLKEFFVKGIDTNIKKFIDKITKECVLEKIDDKAHFNLGPAINMRFELIKYFSEGAIDMGKKSVELYNTLLSKIDSKEVIGLDSDDEFYFAAGQLTKFLISKSEANELSYSVIENCIRQKNEDGLKKEIGKLLKKYMHAINAKSIRENNLINYVMGYENNSEFTFNYYISGFSSRNVIYYKEEVENEK